MAGNFKIQTWTQNSIFWKTFEPSPEPEFEFLKTRNPNPNLKWQNFENLQTEPASYL